jgi:hypothetical protein
MSLYLFDAHWMILKFKHFTVSEYILYNVEILSWYFESISTTYGEVSADSVKNDCLLAYFQRSIFAHAIYLFESFFNLI